MSAIKLEGLTKQYLDNKVAVDNIYLEIEKGEFLVLVGPSGCGKSTTLRMIAGLEEISAGTIIFGDKVVNKLTPAERNIAMVFQNYALYPHKTIYENIAFGLKKRKVPKEEIEKIIAHSAKMLGLETLLKRKPKQLSGGQRQRVALARAIVREPELFLFDEPLSNLDASLRTSTRTELAKLHQRLKATMVYVTHDQVEAMTLGTRIAVMNKGKIEQVDTPYNLYNHPKNLFVASFIGTPQMNLIPVKLEMIMDRLVFRFNNKMIQLTFDRFSKLRGIQGKEVVIGVRPDHLMIAESGEGDFSTTINSIEYLGSEIMLFCSVNNELLIAKVDRSLEPKIGDAIDLKIAFDCLHLFDAETEKSLTL